MSATGADGVGARAATWLQGRSPRERVLLGVAGALATTGALLAFGLALRDGLLAARAAVATHEQELAQVRRLAALVERARTDAPAPTADAPSLPSVLEAMADDIVGRERIASMTPAPGDDGATRIALRVADASLEETVRLLHALESAAGPLVVERLGLEKHPDDSHRFEAVLEVATPGAGASGAPETSPRPARTGGSTGPPPTGPGVPPLAGAPGPGAPAR